ncbi:hypothetical protein MHPYR_500010 [uncultured Mycobacterium sp.]|uniref:Uncharacterized protein n=1 Tax=uncultured Mycobacterium sp. TaxID=171292 RepID=A0A1Y5PHC5_9MYCO|nr:hypothetical protein MHPYR_500010 [uncultured Mycobacterium sp.]
MTRCSTGVFTLAVWRSRVRVPSRPDDKFVESEQHQDNHPFPLREWEHLLSRPPHRFTPLCRSRALCSTCGLALALMNRRRPLPPSSQAW